MSRLQEAITELDRLESALAYSKGIVALSIQDSITAQKQIVSALLKNSVDKE